MTQDNGGLAALEQRVADLERLVAGLAVGELTLRCLGIADADGVERVVFAIEADAGKRELVLRDLYGGRLEGHLLGRSPEETEVQDARVATETGRRLAVRTVERRASRLTFSVHALRGSMEQRRAWSTGADRVRDDAAKLSEVLRALRDMVERDPWPAGAETLERYSLRLADAEALVSLHDQRLSEDEAARRPVVSPGSPR